MEDYIAWHYDSKGLHSVKMVYKLRAQISRVNGDERGSTSSRGQGDLRACADRLWTRLWKLAYPSKIKMFVWRLAHDSVAVRANLIRKGMVLEDERCPMCGFVCIYSAHLFIRCKKVKELWRVLELAVTRMLVENTVTTGECLNIISELPKRKRMEVFHFMWHWWNKLNKKRNGEQVKSRQVISHDARVSITKYVETWLKKEKRRSTEEKKWQIPQQENLKFNIDASFIRETNTTAWVSSFRIMQGLWYLVKQGEPSLPLIHMQLRSGL
ncbi:hypothetical protein D1007_58274 [Hordeum vulgare]|nr:hypothetical protein D1007_58274 [Hordeum vulgare]